MMLTITCTFLPHFGVNNVTNYVQVSLSTSESGEASVGHFPPPIEKKCWTFAP